MLKSNVKFNKVKLNVLASFFGSLMMMILLSFPQNGTAQISSPKNSLLLAPQFGKHYSAFHVQYQRSLNSQFAMVGTLGVEAWKKKLENLKKGKLAVRSTTFGIGSEWSFDEKPGGFFAQGNLLIRNTTTAASGKVETPRQYSGSGYNSLFPVVSVIASVLTYDWDGGYTEVNYEESNVRLGFDGKIGYKFISNGGGMTFSPFIGFETIPVKEESISLKSYDGKYETRLNPVKEFSNVGLNFGFQWGFLF